MIIGLDAGGTHTDAVLLGPEGLVREVKVPTDTRDLFKTVLDGLTALTEGIDVREIRRIVLSTTLATNLVVQQKLPAVGMVVSGGPGIDPELFRTNPDFHVVAGALDHRGRQIIPPDTRQIEEIAAGFARQGIRYAGVVSKFSVRNPEHEKIMAQIVAPHVERVFMGHSFSGGLNFPRRIATTYLNAAVFPVHREFFEAVRKVLDRKGLSVPIRILKPDGGNMQFDVSLDYPAQTILSGPSASVMGSIASAPCDKTCLALDIGGTTTDMAVLVNGVPLLSPLGIEIGPYKTLIRALLTQSIGIGGDSAVRLKEGRLTVGPDRIGRAMAYGGPVPTPTDAFCVLGMTDTGDRDRAVEGLTPLAQALGLSLEETAGRIFDEACGRILAAAQEMVDHINSKPVYTVHELMEGIQIRPQQIMVMGGPAQQFARRLAPLFDGTVSVVPHWHVANALGCALARTTSEVVVYADTSQQIAMAPGEHFSRDIALDFDLPDARELAFHLLREKALRRGANPNYLRMEVIEESSFNMVRGFRTVGKNIRVRVQIKPGLIVGYDPLTEKLTREDL
jgi:N-methylhydantoinase A